MVELTFFNFFVYYSDQIVQQVFDELGLTLTDEVNTLLSLQAPILQTDLYTIP